MQLSDQHQAWLDGAGGPSLQWAVQFNKDLGEMFDAPAMVPVESAHFAMDARLMGATGPASSSAGPARSSSRARSSPA